MKVVLLGAQRFDPTVAAAAAAIGVGTGRVAIVTAGWQMREPEDEELSAHLGGRTINLRLHRRADDVFRRDPELARAYRERQIRFRHLQDFYRIRLEHLLDSAHVIEHRVAPPELLEEGMEASIGALRLLDRHHLRQCESIRKEYRERWHPSSRPAVREHMDEIAAILRDCEAIAIAGGHVASLLNRLQLFNIADLFEGKPVLAWSAGAMAVTKQVVLYHDSPPQGRGAPQVLDVGLGLVPNVVVLPAPETRLRDDDAEVMAMYSRRFEPATCLAFPRRSWVVWDGEQLSGADGVLFIARDGEVAPFVTDSSATLEARA